tara:strand:+ start:3489 stop:4013 length:525 start_codon:yes stop_codon:yes gene_type:complete
MKFRRKIKIHKFGRSSRFFKSQGYDKVQRRVGIALIILILGLIGFTMYYLVFYAKPVSTSQEFIDSIISCNRASWIREDSQAKWIYIIKGNAKGDACQIHVQLLEMKEGTIGGESLQGKEMECTVLKTETRFPEKDISKCSGELKGELQDIIIQRMHNYLLKNVGEIKEEFEAL